MTPPTQNSFQKVTISSCIERSCEFVLFYIRKFRLCKSQSWAFDGMKDRLSMQIRVSSQLLQSLFMNACCCPSSIPPSVVFCKGADTSHNAKLDKSQILLQRITDSGSDFISSYILSTYLCWSIVNFLFKTWSVPWLSRNESSPIPGQTSQNKIWKKYFLRRLPLSKFLAKTLKEKKVLPCKVSLKFTIWNRI